MSNPWLIAIVGTALATVIGGLILYFVFGVGRTTNIQKNKAQIESIPEKIPTKEIIKPESIPEKIPIQKSITPESIEESIKNAVPLQQKIVAANYKGIKVAWDVFIFSGNTKNGVASLLMHHATKGIHSVSISCEVNASQYPELQVIGKDQIFKLNGTIKEVDYPVIYLEDCNIVF